MYKDAADYFEQIAVDFDSYYDKPKDFLMHLSMHGFADRVS